MAKLSIAEIRKTEIIEAFLRVVSEQGLAKATVREVAEAAECSHGMVRHYFGDKDSMILQVMDYVTKTYLADFQRGISKYDSAMDRLRFGTSWWVDRDRYDIDWGWTLMELWVYSKNNREVAEAIKEYYDLAASIIAGVIRQGIESGEFGEVDAESSADMIIAELDGLVRLWFANPERMPLQAMAKRAAELFEGYLMRGDENG